MNKRREKKTNPKMAEERKAAAERKAALLKSNKGRFSKFPRGTR